MAADPKGKAALDRWLDQKDDLLAGRTPRTTSDGLTVRDLVNHFLTAKEQQRDAGELAVVTDADYYRACEVLVGAFGKSRLVDDLAADDFQSLRSRLAKQYGIHRLGNTVQRICTVFKYAYEAGLIDKPVRFGPVFKQPSARNKRLHRQQNGPRMFEADQLRLILAQADQPLRAMIYLGINCGFGNSDCGKLPTSAIDLKNGWVDFPRPKTAVERRCRLWPETVEAIREALEQRPKAKFRDNDDLVFVTKYGHPCPSKTALRWVYYFRNASTRHAASCSRRRAPAPVTYRGSLGCCPKELPWCPSRTFTPRRLSSLSIAVRSFYMATVWFWRQAQVIPSNCID